MGMREGCSQISCNCDINELSIGQASVNGRSIKATTLHHQQQAGQYTVNDKHCCQLTFSTSKIDDAGFSQAANIATVIGKTVKHQRWN